MLCRRDLLAMQSALEELNFDRLRILSHNLKGSGGAYGFPRLTELGARMEQAAKAADDATVRTGIADFKSFLDSKSR
jgi:HPt (histidine-containing phosphotransfer) domain-containing protein